MSQFKEKLSSNRKLIKTNLYLYANTRTPGVLIECGFLSNPNERYLLQKESYQKKLATAITDGVEIYFQTINLWYNDKRGMLWKRKINIYIY